VAAPGADDEGGRLTEDELTIVFDSYRDRDRHIYVATRASRADAFGTASPMDGVNAAGHWDGFPAMTRDRLTIYFETTRNGPYQVVRATRPNTLVGFSAIEVVANVNLEQEGQPAITSDGGTLYFVRVANNRAGVFVAQRRQDGGFDTPLPVTGIGAPYSENQSPVPAADDLTLYFTSYRQGDGAKGDWDIWMARRAARGDTWSTPVNVQELNTAGEERPSWVSPDGCRLYFSRNSPTDPIRKIYYADRTPQNRP
jgi:hypothetical protein